MARGIRSSRAIAVTTLLWVAIASLTGARCAFAVQASGALVLIPSRQLDVVKGDTITVDVYFENTSTASSGSALPAVLSGPIRVDVASDCAGEQPSKWLQFASGPKSGCVRKAPRVTGCTLDAPGRISISLSPKGLALPASSTR